MSEKTFTWNDAALIWWFITWRSAAVMLTLTIAVSLIASFVNINNLLAELLEWGLIIIGITLQIFFIKIAVNRTYRDFSGPKFRLTASTPKIETGMSDEPEVTSTSQT